ncbi:Gfo/Idh/MocA family protein [Streptomyces sp. NPDC050433]|uniref:Gfo/Idh/MocA family protein n=1 Tax=unclassified Streptomyces TaxID=2593676 RepID=UPI003434AF79
MPPFAVPYGPAKVINWGFVGCGAVTEVKSGPAFADFPSSRIRGVYARRTDRAADWVTRHGGDVVYPSLDDMLSDAQVDAVYIATRPDSHLRFARQVISAGLPAVVERPMGRTAAEAAEIDAEASSSGVPVWVPYYRRQLPRFVLAHRLLREGAVGEVTSVSYRFSQPAHRQWPAAATDWRLDPVISGGGLFRDMAGHALDLIDHLVGHIDRAERVDALEPGSGPAHRLERSVSMAFTVGGTVTGTGSWSYASGVREDCLDILGTKGRMRLRLYLDHLVLIDTPGGQIRYARPDPEHVYSPFVRHVVTALTTGTGGSSTAAAHRTAVWLDETMPGTAAG